MMIKKYLFFIFCSLWPVFPIMVTAGEDPFENVFIDTFGDLVVGERVDDINVQFQYDIPNDFVSATGSAGGSVSQDESMAVLSSSVGATGVASMTSYRNLIYVPGHQGFVFFTALFTDAAADSTQWMGLFDESDGWAVGFDGMLFSILYRRDSSDTIINQASFNVDPLDGTGPSGITLDPANLNVFRLGYGWLGGAPIVFSILKQNGEWFEFHIIKRPNNFTGPSVINPILPMRAEIKKTTGTTDLQLKTASWNAGRVVPRSPAYSRIFSLVLLDATPDAATDTPLITIRNKTTYKGKANKAETNLIFTGVSNSNARSRFRIIKNPTVTLGIGQVYTDVDPNSVVEYVFFDSAASPKAPTYTPGTGNTFITLLLDSDGQDNTFPWANDLLITLLPGESLSVIGNKQGGAGDVDTTITWKEIF